MTDAVVTSCAATSPTGRAFSFHLALDPMGRLTAPFLSEAAARHVGLTATRVREDVGPLLDLAHPDDRAAFEQGLRYALAELAAWRGSVRLRSPEGSYQLHVFEARVERLTDGSTHVHGWLGDATAGPATVAAGLAKQEERLAQVLAVSEHGAWDVDLLRREAHCSERWWAIAGGAPVTGPLPLEMLRERIHPDDRERVERSFVTVLETGGSHVRAQFRLVRDDARAVVVRCGARVLRDQQRSPYRLVGTVSDVTELRAGQTRLRESRERFERLLEFAPIALAILDAHGNTVAVNRRFVEVLGYSVTDIPTVDEWWRKACPDPDDRAAARAAWNAALADEAEAGARPTSEEYRITTKDGRERPMFVTSSRFGDGVISAFVDISPLKAAETAIQALAFIDPLTELPNRRLAMDRLRQALLGARRQQQWGALCFLDLDRFKALNDAWGHDAGDELLREVGRRLRAGVRATDTVARLGGDEFIVVLPALAAREADARITAERLARQLRDDLVAPFIVRAANGITWHSAPSIGVMVFGPDDDDPDQVVRGADLAMYRAKRAGGDRVELGERRDANA